MALASQSHEDGSDALFVHVIRGPRGRSAVFSVRVDDAIATMATTGHRALRAKGFKDSRSCRYSTAGVATASRDEGHVALVETHGADGGGFATVNVS
jgi:hypothetical protein